MKGGRGNLNQDLLCEGEKNLFLIKGKGRECYPQCLGGRGRKTEFKFSQFRPA